MHETTRFPPHRVLQCTIASATRPHMYAHSASINAHPACGAAHVHFCLPISTLSVCTKTPGAHLPACYNAQSHRPLSMYTHLANNRPRHAVRHPPIFSPHQSRWMRPSRCISLLVASKRTRASSTLALCLSSMRLLCSLMHMHMQRKQSAQSVRHGCTVHRLGAAMPRAAIGHTYRRSERVGLG